MSATTNPSPEFALGLRIRTANNDDSNAVLALVGEILLEYGMQSDTSTTDSDLLDIEANYLKRGGVFEVIEDTNGTLVGSVGIYPLASDVCELRKMYLAKSLRGRGHGTRLLERTINRARELGYKRMVLETSSKLETANRMYTRFGFQRTDIDHLSARADQAYRMDL